MTDIDITYRFKTDAEALTVSQRLLEMGLSVNKHKVTLQTEEFRFVVQAVGETHVNVEAVNAVATEMLFDDFKMTDNNAANGEG